MKKVLYTKYNSTRRPEYRISTAIVAEDGRKFVVKKAMQAEAQDHVQQIIKNRSLIKDLYKDMDVIDCTEESDALVFPFINGKGLLDGVNFRDDEMSEIVAKIKEALSKINAYSEDYCCPFEQTDAFVELFGARNLDDEPAIRIANIDQIFGNFLMTEEGRVCCIDYEWVLEFPVPIRYVNYRTLLYVYKENEVYLANKVSFTEFMSFFDYSVMDLDVFAEMEYEFQQHVHGKDVEYIYLQRYHKEVKELKYVCEQAARVPELEGHTNYLLGCIEALEDHEKYHVQVINEQQIYIEKIRKAIKNPFYAVQLILKKLKRKLGTRLKKNTINAVEVQKRTQFYRRKYKDLIAPGKRDYNAWIKNSEFKEEHNEQFEYNPKFSIVMVMQDFSEDKFVSSVKSVMEQAYENWELAIVSSNAIASKIKGNLDGYKNSSKIQIMCCDTKNAVIENVNKIVSDSAADFVMFLNGEEVVKENALYEIVKVLNEDNELDFIYSDEDKVDLKGGERYMPHFKPDWSPDTLMSFNYIGHLAVYRKSLVDEIGGFDAELDALYEYDLCLKLAEKTDKIAHIDKVLCHSFEQENVENTPKVLETERKIKNNALKRRGLEAELELVEELDTLRVNYLSQTNPLVSIIIPSKDNYSILERCVQTLCTLTDYENYEIILVDNGSNDENRLKYAELSQRYNINYIYKQLQFNFSKMCNIGASAANGEYLLFLNDDIEIIDKYWLTRMVGQAEVAHVGAVGAKLYYPGGDKIQHVGVLVPECGPNHAFSRMSDKEVYYLGRNRLDYNWLAVTGACLLVSKEKFNEIGGFDEQFAVTYNDIDLCMSLVEHGYFNVVRNDAILYHHESISRGDDNIDEAKKERLLRELDKLYEKHPRFAGQDCFYNKNLVQDALDFGYNYPDEMSVVQKVNKGNEIINIDASLRCGIDLMSVNEDIYMEGWAFIDGREDNNDIKVDVLLKSLDEQYLVTTTKTYRTDVAERFPEQNYIEFVGYKCNFKKEEIEPGVYEIYVASMGGYKSTKQAFIVK